MSDPKARPKDQPKDVSHPGMMGDETMEQNLDQRGNPAARITEAEVEEAFKDAPPNKDSSPGKDKSGPA